MSYIHAHRIPYTAYMRAYNLFYMGFVCSAECNPSTEFLTVTASNYTYSYRARDAKRREHWLYAICNTTPTYVVWVLSVDRRTLCGDCWITNRLFRVQNFSFVCFWFSRLGHRCGDIWKRVDGGDIYGKIAEGEVIGNTLNDFSCTLLL